MSKRLKNKIENYLTTFSEQDKEKIHFYCSEYLLLNDKRKFNASIKNLRTFTDFNQKEDVKELKILLFEDYTLRHVWKCICWSIKNNVLLETASSYFNLNLDDINYVYNSIGDNYKEEIYRLANSFIIFEPISDEEFATICKKLNKFCNSLVYQKLRFISLNDTSIDLEDLRQELLLQVIKTVHTYEHFKKLDGGRDIDKIVNYSKRALSNFTTNIILYHTKKVRSRIRNVTVECGVCKNCLEGHITKCLNMIQEYQTLVSSIENCKDISYHKGTKFEANDSEEFIKFMKKGLPIKFKTLIDTITDEEDNPEFENWLEQQELHYNDLSLQKRAKFAIQYLGLDESNVKYCLNKKYAEWSK